MYKHIQVDFNRVVAYAEDIYNPKTDELFRQWQTNKKRFIDIFGPNMRIDLGEVKECLPAENELDDIAYNFMDWIRWHCSLERKELDCFESFIYQQKMGFLNNRVVKEDVERKLEVNRKLSKAFKFFISDEKDLDRVQTRYSAIIQQYKLKGHLYLSVHPLDYLSVSETTYDWHSCHSMDGEYHVGNYNYMADDCTLVCYIANEKTDYGLPGFPRDIKWNSKKWRTLLYLNKDDNFLFCSRQYPYELENSYELIRTKILPLFNEGWGERNDIIVNIPEIAYSDGLKLNDEIIKLNKFIYDSPNTHQFNDVLHSSCYDSKYFYIPNQEFYSRIGVGQATTCFKCGCDEICDGEKPLCYDCAGISVCDICGDRIYDNDDERYVDGQTYCYFCAASLLEVCCDCEELSRKENLTLIDGEYYCNDCIPQEKEEKDDLNPNKFENL